jgi:hypothetical protein
MAAEENSAEHKKWNRNYLIVLAFNAILIALFYLFKLYFNI